MGEEISKMAQSEVFNIARKMLNDLASANLEDHMAGVFVKRLRNLDQNEKVLLTGSFSTGINKINIRSTFEIPQPRKDEISQLIKSDISNKAIVTFEIAPQLVSGLELISGGYKIAWNISDYLTSLEDGINQLLKDKVSTV
jgi:F-type H+-transporting ATPase subunit b